MSRLIPPLILAALALIFFSDLVRHPTEVLYSDHSDILAEHLPAKHFLVRSWQETGELPLWCPYQFAGSAFVHDPQVAMFYPPHWPLLLLPETAVGAAMSWLIVLHLVIAGWGAYACARAQGLGWPAALVAGLGFMFAGKWMLHLLGAGHYITIGLAWLPWALLLLDGALRRRSLAWATAAGVVFALLILGTHPQWTFYAGLFLAFSTLGTALAQEGRAGALIRWLAYGAWAAGLAVALAAVQLLPTLEAAGLSTRAGGVASDEILAGGLRALLFFVGPALQTTPASLQWEDRGGFGLPWLVAAALAPFICRGRVRFDAAICLGLIVFALGGAVLVQRLPGFNVFRQPARMLLIVTLPVALLAGQTTQALFQGGDRALGRWLLTRLTLAASILVGGFALRLLMQGDPLRWHVYWLSLLVTVPMMYWLLCTEYRVPSRPIRLESVGRQSLPYENRPPSVGQAPPAALSKPTLSYQGSISNSGPAVLGTRYSVLGTSVGQLLWGLVLLLDVWALARPLVEVRPEADVYRCSACISWLKQGQRILDRDAPGLEAGTPLGGGAPLAAIAGLEPLRGYNPLDNRRYKEYLQFIAGADEPLRPLEGPLTFPVVGNFPTKNRSLLDLLGTRYVLQPSDAATLPGDGWQTIGEDPAPVGYDFCSGGVRALPPYTVFENRQAFPRVFVAPEAAPLPDGRQILAALTTTDFHQRVLLEGWDGPTRPGGSAADFRAARLLEYRPNCVVVHTEPGPAGYLVLADIWYPGWHCRVDGRDVTLYRANYLFRGVELSEGEHTVVFTFEPASYRLGRLISGAALAGLAGLGLLSLCTPRRRRPVG